MLARSGSDSRRAGFSANVRSISASLSLWMAVLSSQEHHDGFATPTTSLPRDLVISTSSEILPSTEVMAINLPAPRGRARSHRTSRLSSRSFRGVRLQSKGCCRLHCWLRSEPRTQRMSLPLPTLRSSSPCASWAAPLSGVCAGSSTGFPRTAPTCLRAVGVTAPPSRQGASCKLAKRLGIPLEWVKFPFVPACMAAACPTEWLSFFKTFAWRGL